MMRTPPNVHGAGRGREPRGAAAGGECVTIRSELIDRFLTVFHPLPSNREKGERTASSPSRQASGREAGRDMS